MTTKTKKSFVGLFFRGIAMGAADVVPGVSGGTIAFITGIYEELLNTIGNLKFSLLKTWRKEGFKAFWNQANLSFLFALLAGIFVSIVSLAKVISWLLVEHPILVWSFFFGLVIASTWLVGKTITKWNLQNIIGLILGAIAAYYITILAPTAESNNLGYIFICGMVAICAMILPGISGSFILLLMGGYLTILSTLTDLISAVKSGLWSDALQHITLLAIFAAGCIVGILAFSRVLTWLFKKAHNLTVAVLTGFLIGSLNKIWPWKIVDQFIIKHAGEPNEEIVPVVEHNVLPNSFTQETGNDNYLIYALLLMLIGFVLIVGIEMLGKQKNGKSQN